jgi:cytochrome c peroxidase
MLTKVHAPFRALSISDRISSHKTLSLLTVMLTAALPAAYAQSSPNFPALGIGPGQWLRLHVIALGTNQGRCQAALGFRDTANIAIGPSKEVDLTIGQSAFLDYPAGDTRIEVRPAVAHLANPSSCFSSMELIDGTGSRSYLSSMMAPPVRPIDYPFPSFVDAGPGESVRVAVSRTGGGACKARVRLRNDRADALAAEQLAEPTPGQTLFMDSKSVGQKTRVLIDIAPSEFQSTAGCMVAAELIEGATGKTTRHVPFSVGEAPNQGAPAPPARTRNGVLVVASSSSAPIGTPISIQPPLGLPPVPIPADNPPTAETIALGRRLFYDKNLSRDRTESCASCHDPAAGFRDPRRVSQGVNGMQGERQSMSISNTAYAKEPFWDGRATSLEDQALGPVQNPLEFGASYHRIEQRVSADPSYVDQFAAAFGPGLITYEKVAKCLASFERTILSGNSPFDRFFYGGDKSAISVSAQRGFGQFTGPAQCTNCHKMESNRYATFSDNRFVNTGIAATSFTELSDQGRWKVSGKEADRGAFRPPSLRDVALHAPYMHDGTLRTLDDVLAYYFRGGNKNRWLSNEMPPVPPPGAVSPQDVSDVVEFLKSLTGEVVQNVGPVE